MKQRTALGLTLAVMVCAPTLGQPTSTNSISLQAKLDGVAGPAANLTVKFFDALTGGAQVGATITLSNVPMQNGIVSVPVSPVDATIFNGSTRYMEVTANGTTLSPRTLVTSVPYALQTRGIFVDESQRVGIGVTTPHRRLVVGSTQQSVDRLPTIDEAMTIGTNLNNAGATSGLIFDTGSRTGGAIVVKKKLDGSNEDNRMIFYLNQEGQPTARQVLTLYENGSARVGGDLEVVDGSLRTLFWVTRAPDGTGQAQFGSSAVGSTMTVFGNTRVYGTTSTNILTITGADVAEPFNVAISHAVPEPTPGMVVSIDPANPGKLMVCSTPYDTKVAGAISGAGGLSVGVVMGKDNTDPLINGKHPVAMSGRVYVYCDASFGAIQPGDRLTTSATPGHAMRVGDATRAGGAVIGKAMTGLKEGKGLVLVLVNLQ